MGYSSIPINKTAFKTKIRTFNFKTLQQKCRLFSEFIKGERWLIHKELFGLVFNLSCIQGGKKVFFDILQNNMNKKYSSYQEKDWDYYFNYCTKNSYMPGNCDNFCPFCNECKHAKNMVLTAKTNKGSVIKLKEKEYFPIEESEQDVYNKLSVAVNSNSDDFVYNKSTDRHWKNTCIY